VADNHQRGPRLPPRWFVRLAWLTHRASYRGSGGRVGLWRPKPGRWGTLRLTTTGRRTGRPRSVIVGYVQDGPNLVTLAMNGWADPAPAWWLNLQTHPDATVELVGETRAVRARAAQGAERSRLWARWSEIDRQLDGRATMDQQAPGAHRYPRVVHPASGRQARPGQGCRLEGSRPAHLVVRAWRPTAPLAALGITPEQLRMNPT
jgi:deazaflavin-dependent oxidoreductase (nitroreductase family)